MLLILLSLFCGGWVWPSTERQAANIGIERVLLAAFGKVKLSKSKVKLFYSAPESWPESWPT